MTPSNEHNNAPAVPLGYVNAGHLHEMQSGRLPYAYLYAAPGVGVEIPVYTSNAPAVPQTVYLVENRTCLLAYASREDADKAVASMPAPVGGGFLVSPVQVFGAPAPDQIDAWNQVRAEAKKLSATGLAPLLAAVEAYGFACQTAHTPAPAPAQEVASAFTTALDIRLAQGWNLTGNAIPVLYTDTINDYQVRRDDVWLCTTDALKTEQEVGLTDEQKTWAVNQLMEQAQVFASAWSLVGGKFDFGNALEEAEQAKTELRSMVVEALRAKGGK